MGDASIHALSLFFLLVLKSLATTIVVLYQCRYMHNISSSLLGKVKIYLEYERLGHVYEPPRAPCFTFSLSILISRLSGSLKLYSAKELKSCKV